MEYGPGHPSPFTGKLAFIIECLESDPFLEENSELIANISSEDYNLNAAQKLKYKVMVERKIFYMNHLCFIKSDKILEWFQAENENAFHYM